LQQAKDVVLSDGFFPCPPTLYYNPSQDPYCASACLGLFTTQDYFSVFTISFVFALISCLTMIILMLTIYFKDKIHYPNTIIFNMSIAAFIGEFGILLSIFQDTNFSIFCKDVSTANDSGLCYFQGLVILFSVNSGIFWWVLVSADLFQKVVLKINITKTRKYYYAFAWGLPTIFVIIMMATQKFGYTPSAPWCVIYETGISNWPNWGYELSFLHLPILITMAMGLVFIIAIIIKIMQFQRNVKRESFKIIWRPFFFLFAYMSQFLVMVGYRFYYYYNLSLYEASYGGYLMCLLFGNGQTCINITPPNVTIWRWFAINSSFMGIYIFIFFGLKKDYFIYWRSKFNLILTAIYDTKK